MEGMCKKVGEGVLNVGEGGIKVGEEVLKVQEEVQNWGWGRVKKSFYNPI